MPRAITLIRALTQAAGGSGDFNEEYSGVSPAEARVFRLDDSLTQSGGTVDEQKLLRRALTVAPSPATKSILRSSKADEGGVSDSSGVKYCT